MTETEKELKETKKQLKLLQKDIKYIKDALLKYFEYHDNGDRNRKYLSYYSADDAIDDIHYVIGDI